MAKSVRGTASCAAPEWVQNLQKHGRTLHYVNSSGNVWLKFHKFAYLRFPPHNVERLDRSELNELFFRIKAPIISYHHLPNDNEIANAVLYLCRDKEYDVDKLSQNNRSKVRRGLKRLTVRRVTAEEIYERGFDCYYDTCVRINIAPISKQAFRAKWRDAAELPFRERWAAFAGDEIAAIGELWICGKWVELLSTKSSNKYLKDYSNNVLFYSILRDVMRRDGIESVSYGLSSVQSASNIESLHQFKLSVNFEAVPVVRKIEVNPFLRPFINKMTYKCANLLEQMFPKARHIVAAKGALDLMANGNYKD